MDQKNTTLDKMNGTMDSVTDKEENFQQKVQQIFKNLKKKT